MNRTNSGISITTGGTTISATFTVRSRLRPRKLMRAIANAASAASSVDSATELVVRMALFANQLDELAAAERLLEVPPRERPREADLVVEVLVATLERGRDHEVDGVEGKRGRHDQHGLPKRDPQPAADAHAWPDRTVGR